MKTKKAKRQDGQSLIEYALILALVAVLAIIILTILGVSVSDVYCSIVGIFGGDPAGCQVSLLWSDLFDDLDDWNFTRGNGWELDEGQLCNTQGGEHRGFTGEENWDDYTINVGEAELDQGNGYGVYFRASDEPNVDSYVFQYDPGYGSGAFLIRKVRNGNETPPIGIVYAPPGYDWNDQSREVEVDVRGDTFTVSLDGEEVLEVQDDEFPNGKVGLRTWDGTRACFDNLTVTE